MFPEVLSLLKSESKSWNNKLSHLHPKSLCRIAKPRVLPSVSLDLKDDVTFCASCMFVTTSRRQLTTKGNKSGSIRKETENNPGDAVSVEQLQ